MRRSGHVAAILSRSALRRLLAIRMIGQFGDGVFQASLAGAVLFNPERQAHASDLAAGFTVLLIPYSLVGPFTGVLLDRWSRQRVLTVANVVRAALVVLVAGLISSGASGPGFYLSALIVISLARFVLSGLSASLPHVVPAPELVTANALTSTVGALSAVLGAGAAAGFRAAIGSDNRQYAIIALVAVGAYLLAAALARTFERADLGPDEVQRSNRESFADVARGLVAGARHIGEVPEVARGLAVVGVQRLGYGLTLVCSVLLYRNHFHSDGIFRAGVGGLTQAITAGAIGSVLAAIITPTMARRYGTTAWIGVLLLVGTLLQLACMLPFRQPPLLAGSLLLGLMTQGIKISVDTLVQERIDDQFRGRVFSLYDALVNIAFVAAAVFTAVALPENGRSVAEVVAVAAAFAVTAAWYVRVSAATPTTA